MIIHTVNVSIVFANLLKCLRKSFRTEQIKQISEMSRLSRLSQIESDFLNGADWADSVLLSLLIHSIDFSNPVHCIHSYLWKDLASYWSATGNPFYCLRKSFRTEQIKQIFKVSRLSQIESDFLNWADWADWADFSILSVLLSLLIHSIVFANPVHCIFSYLRKDITSYRLATANPFYFLS